jgi:uncharacterized repeat protein (TIGR01451 family)
LVQGTIEENEFDGLPNPFIRIYPNAIGSIKISGNVFSNAEDQTMGVIRTSADLSKLTLTIEKNAFINDPINIENLASGSLKIIAKQNWWGSIQGPTVGQFVGDVDYDPWLCDGKDSQPDVIGFQPAASGETCTNSPTRLRFVVQPPNPVFTSEPFRVKVRVEDAQGNLGVNYDKTISLSLANNPAGGSLGGTLAMEPNMGYAEFTDLFINKAGANYRLLATSGLLYTDRSIFFNVVDPSADLSLSLSAPASVNAGASFAYTLTVSNAGPKAATNLTLTLTLPAGVTYQSASGDSWTCTHSAGVVTCTRASLAESASSTVTVTVTAPAQPGEISASATISAASPADPDNSNNSAGATTQVIVLPPTGGFQVFLPLISR